MLSFSEFNEAVKRSSLRASVFLSNLSRRQHRGKPASDTIQVVKSGLPVAPPEHVDNITHGKNLDRYDVAMSKIPMKYLTPGTRHIHTQDTIAASHDYNPELTHIKVYSDPKARKNWVIDGHTYMAHRLTQGPSKHIVAKIYKLKKELAEAQKSKPSQREIGTNSLRRIYFNDTPGQRDPIGQP